MKILVLSNLYPPDVIGGYEIACLQVVDALRALGHDVRVLTGAPRQAVPTVPHVLRRLRLSDVWNANYLGTHPVTQVLSLGDSRYVDAHNVHTLTAVLDEFAPDVVYVCNIIGLGGLGLIGCLQYLKVPWVWQLGDDVPNHLCAGWGPGNPRPPVLPTLAAEFSRQIRGHYVVVSQRLANEIESAGIALNGHVEVIPNWITGERGPARATYYRGGHLKVISAGQIAKHKGIDILIEAAGRLRESGFDDFTVDIFGKVNDRYFPYLIRKLGLEEHVRLAGYLDHRDLVGMYGRYDVLAFPTEEREPFGLTPLEAAARGCVPVISQNCGIAEWLVHGIHCLKADRTPEAFAEVFGRIQKGQVDLEPIGRLGAAAAWRDFHIDAILPRIERMLARASRQSRAGAGTAEEAYCLARMAEQLTQVLIEEALVA